MIIPSHYLDRLRAAGLLVSEPFISTHLSFPDGHSVGKPQSVGGNSIPGFEAFWGDENILLDAPAVFFHATDDHWIVTAQEYMPGPGPGDFTHCFTTPDEAVADILDFYFGDPARIALYRQAFHDLKQ